MSNRKAIFKVLVCDELQGVPIGETLDAFDRLVKEEREEDTQLFEGAAIWRRDPRYELFRPAGTVDCRPDPDETVGCCALDNLIYTYSVLKTSVRSREFDSWQVVFLIPEVDLWDDSIERICEELVKLHENEHIHYTFLKGGRTGGKSEIEQYLEERNCSDGDAVLFLAM